MNTLVDHNKKSAIDPQLDRYSRDSINTKNGATTLQTTQAPIIVIKNVSWITIVVCAMLMSGGWMLVYKEAYQHTGQMALHSAFDTALTSKFHYCIMMTGATILLAFAYTILSSYFDDPWAASLIHAISTALYTTGGFILRQVFYICTSNSDLYVVPLTRTVCTSGLMPISQLHDTSMCFFMVGLVNLIGYLISDLFNKNKVIFIIHHIVSIAGAAVALFWQHVLIPIVGTLAMAEWSVPWLFMSKKGLATPWSYVLLLASHVVFRICIPIIIIHPQVHQIIEDIFSEPLSQPSFMIHLDSIRTILLALWYIYVTLQVWWLFTMLWVAYRQYTLQNVLNKFRGQEKDWANENNKYNDEVELEHNHMKQD